MPPTTLYKAVMHAEVLRHLPLNQLPVGVRLLYYPPGTPAAIGTALFSTFTLVELTQQVRCETDPAHAARLQRFRDPNIAFPVDDDLLNNMKVLTKADVQLDPSWVDALYVVPSNVERLILNYALAVDFARRHGLPFIRWQLPLKDSFITAGLCQLDLQLLYDQNVEALYGFFVYGMPAFVTANVATLLGFANGSPVVYHSLSFDSSGSHHAVEAVAAAHRAIAGGGAGEIVTLDLVPFSVNVSVAATHLKGAFPPNLSLVPGSIVIPLLQQKHHKEKVKVCVDLQDGSKRFGDIQITPHCNEAGLCITVHAVQVQHFNSLHS